MERHKYDIIGEWSVMNKGQIMNKGQKYVQGYTSEGTASGMMFQACGVGEPLGSVWEMNEAGLKVVFERGNSYIENQDGVRTNMKEANGKYVMPLRVPKDASF